MAPTMSAKSHPVAVDPASLSYKWFNSFIEGDPVEVTEDTLRTYLTTELKINFDKLEPELAKALPLMLVAFMKTWSGWHFFKAFRNGEFTVAHYYSRFQKFLKFKVNATVKTLYASATKELKRDEVYENQKVVSKATSSNNSGENAPFAPYTVLVTCPPSMLNTIVFTHEGDDVILKHHLGREWKDLSTIQLMNWPHIRITFVSDDLFFMRSQVTTYNRFLNFLTQDTIQHNEAVVESIENNIGSRGERTSYTYRLIATYVQQYLDALRKLRNLNADKFEEIDVLLHQFLEDIALMNINSSFATDTRVLFKLSQTPFIRNKKLMKGDVSDQDPTRVGYCEVVNPKIELFMKHFKGGQKYSGNAVFESVERIKTFNKAITSTLRGILPKVYYKCTFCNKDFFSYWAKKDILEHLREKHRMEQPVRCTVCKKQFDVMSLAAFRWKHKCLGSQA